MYGFVDTTENPEGSAWLPSEALQINGEYIENMIDGYQTLTVSGPMESVSGMGKSSKAAAIRQERLL